MRAWSASWISLLLLLSCVRAEADDCDAVITSPLSLLTVINAGGQEVVVCFDGDNQGRPWSMANQSPLLIGSNQKVIIDCDGQMFDYHSDAGNLTVLSGAVLEYRNCHLLHYEYPDHGSLYGSIHQFKDSWIGMDKCQFVEALGNQYAGILSTSQPNATFLLGELIMGDVGSAVHMFYAAFDSLVGPQVRFVHENTTAYCGDSSTVARAETVSRDNGAVVTLSSEGYKDRERANLSQERPETETKDDSGQTNVPTWFIVVASIAGTLFFGLTLLGCFLWRRRQTAQKAATDTPTDENEAQSHQVEFGSKTSMEEHAHKLSEKHRFQLS